MTLDRQLHRKGTAWQAASRSPNAAQGQKPTCETRTRNPESRTEDRGRSCRLQLSESITAFTHTTACWSGTRAHGTEQMLFTAVPKLLTLAGQTWAFLSLERRGSTMRPTATKEDAQPTMPKVVRFQPHGTCQKQAAGLKGVEGQDSLVSRPESTSCGAVGRSQA